MYKKENMYVTKRRGMQRNMLTDMIISKSADITYLIFILV